MHIFKDTIINEFAKLQCFSTIITALEKLHHLHIFTLSHTQKKKKHQNAF